MAQFIGIIVLPGLSELTHWGLSKQGHLWQTAFQKTENFGMLIQIQIPLKYLFFVVYFMTSVQATAQGWIICWQAMPLTHLPLDKMAATFTDNIFRCIFMNEKFCIFFLISLKVVLKGQINNNPALV